MLTIETKTKLKPADVLKQAVDFFGPNGYKLVVTDNTTDYAAFEGGGGGVAVSTKVDGKKTVVELTSREWDYQVREFIAKIS